MFLCRRWRTSWWRCAGSSILTSSSRPSKCPRPHLHHVTLAGAVCVSRSRRRNSWWKCLRSYLILRCMGWWSRTLTFQLLMVGVVSVVEVFTVYTQDKVLQRAQIFLLIPVGKKRKDGSAFGVGTGCGHQLIHAGGSAGCGCSSLMVVGNFWSLIQKYGGLGDWFPVTGMV